MSKIILNRRQVLVAGAAAALVGPGLAQAQEFPVKPVRLLVSSSAGSGIDITARTVAEALAAGFGQSVLVENITGASGMVAMQEMLKSPADGHTIMLMSPGLTIHSARGTNGFDIRRDVAAIVQQSAQPLIMFVRKGSGIETMADFLSKARAAPGSLNYGSLGVGSVQHLMFEQFKLVNDIDLVHIPYKGANVAAAAVLSGEIDVSLAGLLTIQSMIEEDQLVPIATTTAGDFHGIPGMAKAGIDNYDFPVWTGFGTCGGTPKAVVDKLNQAINAAYHEPAVLDVFKNLYALVGGTPEAFTAVLAKEVEAWTRVIKESGIKFS
jgi:tripartite-type tricarboxylate transporter receptor subunit TctC